MLRLFLFFYLLNITLFGCESACSSCMRKAKDTDSIRQTHLAIPLQNNLLLIYSSKPPKQKIIKSDPFLGLYLVQEKTESPYSFNLGPTPASRLCIVDAQRAQEGIVITNQIGLNTLARLNQKYKPPALIMDSCCSLWGIATETGVIQKEYIKHFLSKEPLEYGDIGVRIEDRDTEIIVSARDPFIAKNPFKKGDIIVELNGEKIEKSSLFMQKVLFSKVGSKQRVKVKRSSELLEFELVAQKRHGGANISDTFLESRGIYFDKEMRITKLSEAFREYGFLLGDRLIQVNGVLISTQEELRRYIEDFQDYSVLLFERENFEFFVNIK